MRKIFKYQLKITHEQTILMPKDAEIISVQFQRGVLCVWAIVAPSNPEKFRVFELYGTGADFPTLGMAERKYIATVQEGPFVWHVFEPIN